MYTKVYVNNLCFSTRLNDLLYLFNKGKIKGTNPKADSLYMSIGNKKDIFRGLILGFELKLGLLSYYAFHTFYQFVFFFYF